MQAAGLEKLKQHGQSAATGWLLETAGRAMLLQRRVQAEPQELHKICQKLLVSMISRPRPGLACVPGLQKA
jgi:hypothetical protein